MIRVSKIGAKLILLTTSHRCQPVRFEPQRVSPLKRIVAGSPGCWLPDGSRPAPRALVTQEDGMGNSVRHFLL